MQGVKFRRGKVENGPEKKRQSRFAFEPHLFLVPVGKARQADDLLHLVWIQS